MSKFVYYCLFFAFVFVLSLAFTAACGNDDECNDNNLTTMDVCVNPNTIISACANFPVNCGSDSECGSTGFFGESYCFGDNINRNYRTAICNNAGSNSSYCEVRVTSNVSTQCSLGCENNMCIQVECGDGLINQESEQCDDGNTNNLDGCSALCQIEEIRCDEDSDCDDDNVNTDDICINPGNFSSYCVNNPINQTNQTEETLNIVLISPGESEVFKFNVSIPLRYYVNGSADSCFYNIDNTANITLTDCLNSSFNISKGEHIITIFALKNNTIALDSNNFLVNLTINQTNGNGGGGGGAAVGDHAAENETFSKLYSEILRDKYLEFKNSNSYYLPVNDADKTKVITLEDRTRDENNSTSNLILWILIAFLALLILTLIVVGLIAH